MGTLVGHVAPGFGFLWNHSLHSLISITFFLYAACAIILDRAQVQAQFAQQLLLLHLHSADHMGPEGRYHLLLQILVFVSLFTTLIGIGHPHSLLVNFVRSVSIFFQGLWLIVMGFMLWTPSLIPKGCYMVVRCSSPEAPNRAVSLVKIEFNWFVIGVTVFAVSLYLVLVKLYGEKKVQYFSLGSEDKERSKYELICDYIVVECVDV
ncbi:hypothetical protein GYH30_045951 [Glycine max]|uniref:Uncharacterized protein n=2 Tax=Glycine subgen. Soja TaxID=1462606 RepID=K7MJH8_SOYBN|nr:hypothetical protein GYH30_045951 [Glycine max]RZB54736.1 hypothetical protein D0Y65_044604 [Glycine soja]